MGAGALRAAVGVVGAEALFRWVGGGGAGCAGVRGGRAGGATGGGGVDGGGGSVPGRLLGVDVDEEPGEKGASVVMVMGLVVEGRGWDGERRRRMRRGEIERTILCTGRSIGLSSPRAPWAGEAQMER